MWNGFRYGWKCTGRQVKRKRHVYVRIWHIILRLGFACLSWRVKYVYIRRRIYNTNIFYRDRLLAGMADNVVNVHSQYDIRQRRNGKNMCKCFFRRKDYEMLKNTQKIHRQSERKWLVPCKVVVSVHWVVYVRDCITH